MELHEKNREELISLGNELKIEFKKNISDSELRELIEKESITRTVRLEEETRSRIQEESRIRREIAEIKAKAELSKVDIKIPENPTLDDVARLKTRLGILEKEPKPSPETLAIENSKKVYAIFHNLEQDDLDVTCIPGGKYRFHFWPEKVHVVPEWLIGFLRKTAVAPIYERKEDPLTKESICVRVGERRRFMFEVLEDAPDDAKFGVVLDYEIQKT